MFSTDDTIVAIATPPGRAGLGVIRISGPDAQSVASKLLTRRDALSPRHATLSHVRDLTSTTEDRRAEETPAEIDQVVATFFPRPHSYTGEDVVEIAAHGSPVLLERIVASALRAGARLAAPGEFTLRAFLHGRVDLVQAEAVADLIDAVTPAQARQAFDQLDGTLTRAMAQIGEALFDLVVKLEASLDFPDEGYHFIMPNEVSAALAVVHAQVGALLASARQGRVIREGRQVAIVGGTNVGKSSLFNAFIGAERAIVTEIAGTTRDLLTERCDVGGIPITLVDTAGIRETDEIVEREGVQRARAAAQTADLVLVVIDRSRPLREQDRTYIDAAGSRRLIVINKVDLPAAWSIDDLVSIDGDGVTRVDVAKVDAATVDAANVDAGKADAAKADPGKDGGGAPSSAASVAASASAPASMSTLVSALGPSIDVSVRTGAGMDRLRETIATTLIGDERLRDTVGVSNVRHIELLGRVSDAVQRAREGAAAGAPEEFVLADIREAIEALEEITGKRSSDDVLQAIFSRFCIGK